MHKRSLCPSKKVIPFFHQAVFNRVAAASEAGFGMGSLSLALDSWGLAQLNDPPRLPQQHCKHSHSLAL